MAYLLIPLLREAPRAQPGSSSPPDVEPLAAWVAIASASPDACLVLDGGGRVAAVSGRAATLLGRDRGLLVGQPLAGDLLGLVDFTSQAGPADSYAMRIPPLLALHADAPARGLLRIRHDDGKHVTLDAVAAPIHGAAGQLAGSVSFLAAVATA